MLLTINYKLIYTRYGEGSNGDLVYIYRMQHQHATATTTDQIGAAHHDTAINATCVRGHYFLYKHSHHASCIDCCIVLCCLHLGGVVVVACCCCILYRLALMLALIFAPCACGVSPGANKPRAQVVVATSCMLCWWCFSTVQRLHLHTWWYTSHSGTCI